MERMININEIININLLKIRRIYGTVVQRNLNFDFESKMYRHGLIKDIKKINKLLYTKAKASILDVGCGRGTLCAILSELNYKVVGIDLKIKDSDDCSPPDKRLSYVLPQGLQTKVWKKLEENFTNVHYTFYNGVRFPFKNDSFDMVSFYAVLEHIPEQSIHLDSLAAISTCLNEGKRVLKEDGYLYIARLPRQLSYTEHLAKLLGFEGHKYTFKERDIQSLLEKHGFKIVEFERTDMVPGFIPFLNIDNYNRIFSIIAELNNFLLKTPLNLFSHHTRIICKLDNKV